MLKNANLIRIKTLQVTNQKIRRPYVFVKILTGSESSFSDNFSSSSLRRPISSSLSSFSPPHRVDVGATDVIAKSLSNSLGSCFALITRSSKGQFNRHGDSPGISGTTVNENIKMVNHL